MGKKALSYADSSFILYGIYFYCRARGAWDKAGELGKNREGTILVNYFKLAYTTPDILSKIKEAEKRGDYNSHLDTVDYDQCCPVDESFP